MRHYCPTSPHSFRSLIELSFFFLLSSSSSSFLSSFFLSFFQLDPMPPNAVEIEKEFLTETPTLLTTKGTISPTAHVASHDITTPVESSMKPT